MDQYDFVKRKLLSTLIRGSAAKDHGILIESIVQGGMASELLQQLLADLRAKRHLAQTAPERIAIDGAIADVLDGIFASGGTLPMAAPQENNRRPSEQEPTTAVQALAERPISKHSQFYGLGLREAAPKVLALVKEPQLAREVWDVLNAEGFKSAHNNPAHAVYDALRRRAKTHGDVLLVGGGKWGRTDWYTEAELAEIRKSVGGMGGRDRGAHSESTRAGMLVALDRGVRLGAARKLTPEQEDQVVDMVRAGATIAKAAEEFGISPGSVNNFLRARGLSSRILRKQRADTEGEPSADGEPEGTRH